MNEKIFIQENIYKAICPNCKKELDSVSHEENILPKQNDITICIYCGQILKFNENLVLGIFSENEIIQLMQTDLWIDIRKKQDMVFRIIKAKPKFVAGGQI